MEWFPEFSDIKTDYDTVDYQYTFNPVKDNNLEVNDTYGVRFESNGRIRFEYKFALRLSTYIGGYRTEIRTLYPHLKFEAQLTLNEDKSEIRLEIFELLFKDILVTYYGEIMP